MRKPQAFAQDPVERLEWGRALGRDVGRFQTVTAPDLIDDEARRIRHAHGFAAKAARQIHQDVADALVAAQAVDHLDEFHDGHGIEEVHAGHALGPLADGGHAS